MTIDRKAQRPAAPDRDANPIVPWLHGLAAMGDERWHEAIPALQRFSEMVGKSEDRVLAYRNLSACYLALERFDEALAALDEVRRLDSDLATPYGEPMQGTLIYLNQQPQPGLLVSTMRLPGTSLGS